MLEFTGKIGPISPALTHVSPAHFVESNQLFEPEITQGRLPELMTLRIFTVSVSNLSLNETTNPPSFPASDFCSYLLTKGIPREYDSPETSTNWQDFLTGKISTKPKFFYGFLKSLFTAMKHVVIRSKYRNSVSPFLEGNSSEMISVQVSLIAPPRNGTYVSRAKLLATFF